MSEEKLYAVKNDEGEYWDFEDQDGFFELRFVFCPTTSEEKDAKDVIHGHGGHVVTLIEEPEKVVLSEKQAESVELAHISYDPAGCISLEPYEELLMKAYVNGYTVKKEKEKKYNVKVPYAVESYFKKIDDKYCIAGNRSTVDLDEDSAQFTEAEIEHYGLQDCEKEEVTDDGIR